MRKTTEVKGNLGLLSYGALISCIVKLRMDSDTFINKDEMKIPE